jgi:importin-4
VPVTDHQKGPSPSGTRKEREHLKNDRGIPITDLKAKAQQEILAQVEALLLQVTSAQDTDVLKRTTKQLQETFYKTDICVPVLVHILQHSHHVSVRQLAALEAKKLVPKFWDESFAPQIRGSLLESTLAEPDAKTRHASARLVSAIGAQDLPEGKWPELIMFCQQASVSTASDREVGLFIIYSLFETVPDIFEGKLESLLQLFHHTVNDRESRKVRQTTLLCLGELATRIYEHDKRLYVDPLIALTLQD